ncbi:SDR family NAD(P)-dependent oxidoreductase [Desulfatitalea alkaliphila]|uniref:SDR family NAD(P)-dependent oxidoreductase n=1 Tax=Desulfatitalea alkaliphila TaxID=2929485 RepID=A0AA41UNG0_9BACT|nr:SDR family NAD(P)-dependent oxidoreductase [Desulfatitalea alkaliphila]MCJ8499483.1 SDR family NAD(P)-dependent oxidoreductase [Desulfatitalea alkaliphila]
MALNLEAVGQTLGPMTKHYTWKDVVLYALGVGAGENDLHYCYEKDLKVIPSFAIASIFDVLAQIGIKSEVNLAGVLHGEQELIFHRPIPTEGSLTTKGRIRHIYDKGPDRGALIIGESDTVDEAGNRLFTSICTVFGRLDGGFGGPDAPKRAPAFPDRAPDTVVAATPAPSQPLLYRLSGDTFSLHVDPEFARLSGFEKPIMHGLCTHGYACRALCDTLIPGAPEKARRMACRFSKPLYPGMPIQTLIWRTEQGKALWRVVNAETGEVVIDNGEFEYGDEVPPRIRFDGRVAIVTGAGGGLGRAYALELARRGAKVVVNDLGGARDGSGDGAAAPADRVVAEIRAAGGEAVADHNSVATVEGGAAIVQTALEAFGTVDILINNAGILRDKSFVNMTPENWQAVLDVHLHGAYHVTRPAFAVMRDKGYGRILMTTSAAGLYGNFGQSNYAAAKMGLVGLMNTLKLEGEKRNIKVNTIAPLAASRLTEDILPPDLFAKMQPEYVVPLALFLCTDQCPASGNIYNAGMGFFNRVAVMTGPGAVPAAQGAVPTPEAVRDQAAAITDLEAGRTFGQLAEQVMDVVTKVQ